MNKTILIILNSPINSKLKYFSGNSSIGFKRLRQLESLILENGSANLLLASDGVTIPTNSGKPISIEALLDCLLVLYDECCNSSLRREKTVSEFIELGIITMKSFIMNFNITFF